MQWSWQLHVWQQYWLWLQLAFCYFTSVQLQGREKDTARDVRKPGWLNRTQHLRTVNKNSMQSVYSTTWEEKTRKATNSVSQIHSTPFGRHRQHDWPGQAVWIGTGSLWLGEARSRLLCSRPMMMMQSLSLRGTIDQAVQCDTNLRPTFVMICGPILVTTHHLLFYRLLQHRSQNYVLPQIY